MGLGRLLVILIQMDMIFIVSTDGPCCRARMAVTVYSRSSDNAIQLSSHSQVDVHPRREFT